MGADQRIGNIEADSGHFLMKKGLYDEVQDYVSEAM